MQTLTEYLAENPQEREHIRAPLVCPRHGIPTVTVAGWASRMDATPTQEFMADAAENPCCLMVGEYLEPGDTSRRDPKRLVFCTACEDGMAALRAERHAAYIKRPSRKAARRQARLARRREKKGT